MPKQALTFKELIPSPNAPEVFPETILSKGEGLTFEEFVPKEQKIVEPKVAPEMLAAARKVVATEPEPEPFTAYMPLPKRPTLAPQPAYLDYAKQYSFDPNHPVEDYDYRAAFETGTIPKRWRDLPEADKREDIAQGRNIPPDAYMWPDEFKGAEHKFPPVKPMGLIKRAGKQFTNRLILDAIEAWRPSSLYTKGSRINAARMKNYRELGGQWEDIPLSDKITKFPQYLWADFRAIYGNESRAKQAIAQAKLQEKRGAYKIQLPPPEGIAEKGVDVVAGLSAFITKLWLLKKVGTGAGIIPKGSMTGDMAVWEALGLAEQDIPGMGAGIRGTLGVIGKTPTSTLAGKIAKTGAESTLFAGVTAATGGSPEDIIISSLVPVAFNSWNFARQRRYLTKYEQGLKAKATNEYNKRIREGMPEPTSRAYLKADKRIIDNAVAKAKQTIYHDDAFAPAREKWQAQRQKALKLIATGDSKKVRIGSDILNFLTKQPAGVLPQPIEQQIKAAKAQTKAIRGEKFKPPLRPIQKVGKPALKIAPVTPPAVKPLGAIPAPEVARPAPTPKVAPVAKMIDISSLDVSEEQRTGKSKSKGSVLIWEDVNTKRRIVEDGYNRIFEALDRGEEQIEATITYVKVSEDGRSFTEVEVPVAEGIIDPDKFRQEAHKKYGEQKWEDAFMAIAETRDNIVPEDVIRKFAEAEDELGVLDEQDKWDSPEGKRLQIKLDTIVNDYLDSQQAKPAAEEKPAKEPWAIINNRGQQLGKKTFATRELAQKALEKQITSPIARTQFSVEKWAQEALEEKPIEKPIRDFTEEQLQKMTTSEIDRRLKALDLDPEEYTTPASKKQGIRDWTQPAPIKEIKYEEEAITEPAPSPQVEPRLAAKVIPELKPTGKLDPTKPEEALEITKHHAKWMRGAYGKDRRIAVGGIFETKWDEETGEYVISSVEYTNKQIDTAYRTIQKAIDSPMPDTALFAMPGKEAQMQAIAQKMQKVKPVSRKIRRPAKLTKPAGLPKAKTEKADHIKAVYKATAKETTRYAINGVKVEGDTIIATDGRRMLWAKGKWGKDGLYLNVASLKNGLLGKSTQKTDLKFPDWRAIVPDVSGEKPILVGDLETVWRRVRQATLITTEESRGITIIVNSNGSLGFAAASPEEGHVEINIHPGGKILGGVNPQFLLDVLSFHAIRGNKSFEFYFPDWQRPILTKSFDGKTNTITMPINIEIEKPSEAIKEAISEWPVAPVREKVVLKGKIPAPTKAVAPLKKIQPLGKIPTKKELAELPPPPEEQQRAVDKFLDHIEKPAKPPRMEPGFAMVPEVPMPIKQIATKAQANIAAAGKNLKEDIDQFRFYPKAPPKFRNTVRIDLIGALTKARKNIYEGASNVIWGKLGKKDIAKSVEIIYARDQLSRTKLGKGNPKIELEEAFGFLDDALGSASPEAIAAADRFKIIHDKYTDRLIRRGVLAEGQRIEDHVHHYIEDYTPEWAPTTGIPARLKRPFRGYAKRAMGTIKEYRQDQDALLASLMEMEHHNLIEDFIETQVKEYDIKPKLSKEVKKRLFGTDTKGYAKVPRPGRIYIIDGKRYRAYTPDIPFSRALYLTKDGEAALGSFKNVALIPEDIYNLFRDFSQRGSRAIYLLNRATGWWKTMAILSHYSSFNVNNFVGDTWVALVQHPAPLELLAEYDTAIEYLIKERKPKAGYLKQLDDFIVKHDVKQTFSQAELQIGRRARNPGAWLLRASYKFSDKRETINRAAYASSLLRAMKRGDGPKMVEAHDWIDTEGLTTEDALGKISREVLTDYQNVSKPFRRFVRGGIAPFGTWYFKTSARIWKWFFKHPFKAVLAFMTLPIAAAAYNRRRKEIQELEQQLPDYIRNRVHFIYGENPDGTIRVLSLQLPQDVLIGTKIFSIVVDHSNRVINGEMTPRGAALETIKTWGIREYEGAKYLLTPWVRMYSGLKTGKDPYDKANVYRRDYNKMTWDEIKIDQAAYILKTSVPFLGYSIQTYEKGLPQDIAYRKLMDTLAGKGALGIYDVNKKGQLVLEHKGKKAVFEWKDIFQIRKLAAREYKYLGQLEDDFVASEQKPQDFLKSVKARESLLKIYGVWANRVPELKKVTDEKEQLRIVVSALGERITNRIITPRVLQKWYQVKQARAKTLAEKIQIAKEYREVKKQRIIEVYKTLPKSAREIELVRKIKAMD